LQCVCGTSAVPQSVMGKLLDIPCVKVTNVKSTTAYTRGTRGSGKSRWLDLANGLRTRLLTPAPRVPRAVTRGLLSGPLRYVGPVEEGGAWCWRVRVLDSVVGEVGEGRAEAESSSKVSPRSLLGIPCAMVVSAESTTANTRGTKGSDEGINVRGRTAAGRKGTVALEALAERDTSSQVAECRVPAVLMQSVQQKRSPAGCQPTRGSELSRRWHPRVVHVPCAASYAEECEEEPCE